MAWAQKVSASRNLSPDGKFAINYSVDYSKEPPAQKVTLESGGKVIWTHHPAISSRGVSFNWSPASNGFFMLQASDTRKLDGWFVLLDPQITTLDLDLRNVDEWIGSRLVEKGGSKAPKANLTGIKWLNGNACEMKYHLQETGSAGSALLKLSIHEGVPRLEIVGYEAE